jgi:glycosyltransferase involved in cell wall biosynthesis
LSQTLEARELLDALTAHRGQDVVVWRPIGPSGILDRLAGAPSGPNLIDEDLLPSFDLRAQTESEERGDLLYVMDETAPWRSSMPVVATAGLAAPPARGRGWRLRHALSRASLRTASAVLLADDLPDRPDVKNIRRVPPLVPEAFLRPDDSEPDAMSGGSDGRARVLAWAENVEGVRRTLAAWTWVDASVGDSFRLTLLCATLPWARRAIDEARAIGLEGSVETQMMNAPEDLPRLYRKAVALVHAGPVPTPQIFRWALAADVPVAAENSTGAASVLGPAGYLTKELDMRALGAAVLTLLVEESVADDLRRRGIERARGYDVAVAVERRLEVFHSLTARQT